MEHETSNKQENANSDLGAVRRSFSLKPLVKAKNNFDLQIKKIEDKIKPFIKFEFFVMYQPSDGFVIVHKDKSHNGILSTCIQIIKEKGILTYEDYLTECV